MSKRGRIYFKKLGTGNNTLPFGMEGISEEDEKGRKCCLLVSAVSLIVLEVISIIAFVNREKSTTWKLILLAMHFLLIIGGFLAMLMHFLKLCAKQVYPQLLSICIWVFLFI
jgi:hypothetical protein